MMFFHCILTLFMAAVLYYDITRFIIPNWITGVLLLLYPCMMFMSPYPVDWLWGLGVGAAALVAGIVIYALKIMGAGDLKLLAVCAMWCGVPAILTFVFGVGILGGVLALVLLFTRPGFPLFIDKEKLPRVLKKGEMVPYGVAIAGSFLIVLWQGQIPGLPL